MRISTKILIAFTVILLLSILDTVSNYVLSVKVEENTTFLSTSQEIIRNSGQFQRAVLEMQSSFRGFLVSQDTNFLQGYNKGLREIPESVADMKTLIKDDHAQTVLLDSIIMLHHQWLVYSQKIINAKLKQNEDPLNDDYQKLMASTFKERFGKNLNDEIAEHFTLLNNIEYNQRQLHSTNLAKSIKNTHIYSLIFITLTICIGVLTVIYVMKSISNRIKSMVNLAEGISKGNFTFIKDEYNDELTALSSSMNVMSSNLDQSITQLEYRNSELDTFAYVVSHDLKAPLRGIYNVIKWIQEDVGDELTPKLSHYLDIIAKRTVRLEHLINGLLEYARLRTKAKAELTNVDVMVKDLIAEIVPDTFTVDIINLPNLVTEHLKLQQVFSNLISNAVKYTRQENGYIAISALKATDHYKFSVKDNGIGIDPVYHEKIFEIFQTLREKDDEESTGIGLSIAKKILDEHHETIHVNSSPGNGSTFTFTWHTNR